MRTNSPARCRRSSAIAERPHAAKNTASTSRSGAAKGGAIGSAAQRRHRDRLIDLQPDGMRESASPVAAAAARHRPASRSASARRAWSRPALGLFCAGGQYGVGETSTREGPASWAVACGSRPCATPRCARTSARRDHPVAKSQVALLRSTCRSVADTADATAVMRNAARAYADPEVAAHFGSAQGLGASRHRRRHGDRTSAKTPRTAVVAGRERVAGHEA